VKILFFLVALANVALLMGEYNKGVFQKAVNISEQKTLLNQEDILLVVSLKVIYPMSCKPGNLNQVRMSIHYPQNQMALALIRLF
jgi:hypothetical protein